MHKLLNWLGKNPSVTLQPTKNIYDCPITPSTKIQNILYDWPSHQGRYRGAVDFAVPVGTPVYAPLSGTVTQVVDEHRIHGPSSEYSKYLNYLTIAHPNGEFSQLGHLAQASVKVKIGDTVHTGQLLAYTGLNGWMEEPYLEHLHFFVFKLLPPHDFIGLQIRYRVEPNATIPT